MGRSNEKFKEPGLVPDEGNSMTALYVQKSHAKHESQSNLLCGGELQAPEDRHGKGYDDNIEAKSEEAQALYMASLLPQWACGALSGAAQSAWGGMQNSAVPKNAPNKNATQRPMTTSTARRNTRV